MTEPKIIKLIRENPELPVVPMVDSEIIGDFDCYWLGNWGKCEVTEYYIGKKRVHFKDYADVEDVLYDMWGCGYGLDKDGRYLDELSDEEWDNLFASLPWIKCIVVYITT